MGRRPRQGLLSLRSESGATAVEYALMLGAIAAVVILTVIALGLSTEGLFDSLVARWQP
jgi:Flp pilus assembly pilin Flp